MARRRLLAAEQQTEAWTQVAAQAADTARRIAVLAHSGQAVTRAAAAVAGELNLDRLVDLILDQSVAVLQAPVAIAFLTEGDRPCLKLVGHRHLPTDLENRVERVPFDAPLLAARAAATCEIQVVEDAASLDSELILSQEFFSLTQMQSALAVPLVAFGRLTGVLSLLLPKPHHFTPEELATLRTIGEIFAVGIANAQAYEERKRIEEDLRQSRERFRLLAEHAHDLIFRYRIVPPIGFEYISPASITITGHTPEEHYADPQLGFKLIHPDDRPTLEEIGRSPERVCRQPVTLRWIRKDGSTAVTELSCVAVRDESGNVVAIEGIARDVTERTQAEASAFAERAWLRTVIDRSPIGMLLIEGPHGERLVANRRAEALFGHPFEPERGIGQYLSQVRRPDGGPLQLEEAVIYRALHGASVRGDEERLRRPDGSEIPIVVSGAPLYDASGAISGAVVIFEDISPIRELERLRDEWTSVIAHDLRQPVTVIMSYAGLLARQSADAPESTRRAVDHIRSSAAQLNRMIADLVDATRVEVRQLPLDRQPVDLPALVRSVVDRVAETAPDRPMRVELRDHIPRLQVDPGRIEQVLSNLLTNAVKYGYEGTEIVVELQCVRETVQVSVTNHGEGIAPEDQPRLFARFYRARNAAARPGEGLGLGLYLARGLVEAHGGRIWVESTPGQTTTFRFTLPLEDATRT